MDEYQLQVSHLIGDNTYFKITVSFVKRVSTFTQMCLKFKIGAKSFIMKTLRDDKIRILFYELGVVVHACSPNTWEAEGGRFLSSSTSWSTE